jgi:uncharacterized membrane protein
MLIEFLKGKWLGHPLHPALVHIPVGMWPAALIFDILSRLDFGGNVMVRLSFYAIAFGLVVTALAIPSGLADWSGIKKEKPAWKIGLIHMALSLAVTALYAVNLGVRLDTFRDAARVEDLPFVLSIIGTVLLLVSAYLGGFMVYQHGVSIVRLSKEKWRKIAESGGAALPEKKEGDK